jgi:uncharacterized protein (DUF2147 family)
MMNLSHHMTRFLLPLTFGMLALSAQAQMTPAGLWRTIDDKTGEVTSEVHITDNAGVLSGRIEKLLGKNAKQDDVCDKCTDDRKDKLVLGMEIIRGAKKTSSQLLWEGGKILDPNNGKEYTLRMTPIEDGKKLQVRGYIAFFYRTQIWVRVP